MSKIWCDLGQLLILTANISGMDRDNDKESTALSSSVPQKLNKEIGELWCTDKKVIDVHVDPPEV